MVNYSYRWNYRGGNYYEMVLLEEKPRKWWFGTHFVPVWTSKLDLHKKDIARLLPEEIQRLINELINEYEKYKKLNDLKHRIKFLTE